MLWGLNLCEESGKAPLKFWREGTPTNERWTYSYNHLNQLTQRNLYSALYRTGVANKWVYTYDGSGNMTVVNKQTGASVQVEKLLAWGPLPRVKRSARPGDPGKGMPGYLLPILIWVLYKTSKPPHFV